MEVSICACLFVIGTFFGSFYHVVGYRLPKNESILFPGSHCPHCNHVLKPWELIPVFSFLFQGGKCSKCKTKISWFYPISEILCGLLFMFCYVSFGFTLDLIIALTFVSMLIIVIFSDLHHMIIEDKVLIVFGILLLIEIIFISSWTAALISLRDGAIAFIIMLLLKLLGDKLFKKESMGGGDIKLMFVIGMVIGWDMALISIFLAAILALPISLIILFLKKDHEIPFGPFLSLGAIIILLTHFNIDSLLEFFRSFSLFI